MLQLWSNISPKLCYYAFGLNVPFYLQYGIVLLIFYKPLDFLLKKIKLSSYILIVIPLIINFIMILRNDPFFLTDDFDHLALSSRYSYLDIAKFAVLPEGIWVNHHIILGFWIFKLIFSIFRTDIVPYFVVVFILHFLNSLLFYRLLTKISNNKILVIIYSLAFSSIYLSWISNVHELIGGTFLLLTLIFWIKYLSNNKKSYYFSFFCYLLAILSKEITFLIPTGLLAITLFWHVKIKKLKFTETLKTFLPYLLVMIIYGIYYSLGFYQTYTSTAYQGSSYEMKFNYQLLVTNFTWYMSLLFKGIKGLAVLAAILVIPFAHDILHKKIIALPFLLAFLIAMLPPLFFTNKLSPYYIYYPAIYIIMMLLVVSDSLKKYLQLIFTKHKLNYIYLNVIFIIILLFNFIYIQKQLMDNCFLIQFPWQNESKTVLNSLTQDIDTKIGEDSDVILINYSDYQGEKINPIISNKILDLFLKKETALKYRVDYKNNQFILIKK